MLSEPLKIRIKFSKTGRLKFISHLDLQRFFSMALMRAGIPVKFSEGFNPHPKMVFTPPLSLGAESECEFLDVKITEEPDFEEMKESLNRASVPDLRIHSVYLPERKLSEIAYAEYRMEFEGEPDFSPLTGESLIVEKKSKRKTEPVDIMPMIKYIRREGTIITCALNASGSSYLNPEYICRAVNPAGYEYALTRTGFLDAEGNKFE